MQLAILTGDFLLARSSILLASLRDPDVIEMLALVIENLVAGEVMQLKASPEEAYDMNYYIQKTFYKTASLIALRSVEGSSELEKKVETASLVTAYYE